MINNPTISNSSNSRSARSSSSASSKVTPKSSTNSNTDKINQLVQITGLSNDESYFYLDMASWDLEKAVEMWEKLTKTSPTPRK